MAPRRLPETAHRDAEYVARIRREDVGGLEALMRAYAEELTNLALLTVHRMDLAQDAVQNVFIALWERRSELAIEGSVPAYLYRAVRNQAVTLLRHERAEQHAYEVVEHAYVVGEIVSWNEGETRIEADELDAEVQRVLDTLQPQVREIFLMHRLQGMSYAEIASVLGISVVTVRSQMSRAVTRIGRAVEGR